MGTLVAQVVARALGDRVGEALRQADRPPGIRAGCDDREFGRPQPAEGVGDAACRPKCARQLRHDRLQHGIGRLRSRGAVSEIGGQGHAGERGVEARRLGAELPSAARQPAQVVQPGRRIHQPVLARPVGGALDAGERVELQEQVLGVERLAQVLPGARPEGIDALLARGVVRADDDDRRVRIELRVVPQRPADLQRILVGQGGVEDDRVGLSAPRPLQRLGGGVRLEDRVAVGAEDRFERAARRLLVARDQDGRAPVGAGGVEHGSVRPHYSCARVPGSQPVPLQDNTLRRRGPRRAADAAVRRQEVVC